MYYGGIPVPAPSRYKHSPYTEEYRRRNHFSPRSKLENPYNRLKLPGINHMPRSSKNLTPHTKTSIKAAGVIRSYSITSFRGRYKAVNEDKTIAIANAPNPSLMKHWPKIHFFGVYDGHGGSSCAEFLRKNLHNNIFNSGLFLNRPQEAITKAFLDVDFEWISHSLKSSDTSGSCAIIVIIIEDICLVANTGDSRAILCKNNGRVVYSLSNDHKPELERERIFQAGGKVYFPPKGPPRLVPGHLAVSRSFGDITAKCVELNGNPKALIAQPELSSFRIKNDCDFIVMGSDGLFDVMRNKDVVRIVRKTIQREDDIHEICGRASRRLMQEAMDRGSLDNVTAVVIALPGLEYRLQSQQY